ncbi:hypothetical protein MB901379_04091 [Mycobacterium basiliense]|uniref:VirB8 protein n=1 Tax=Mycobacterium basiliense TaxID=2094119 RepID=A0A447GJA7_9MYCO|nr:hypothetical protein MB901379_04091 [Mycobacterium basiliense]
MNEDDIPSTAADMRALAEQAEAEAAEAEALAAAARARARAIQLRRQAEVAEAGANVEASDASPVEAQPSTGDDASAESSEHPVEAVEQAQGVEVEVAEIDLVPKVDESEAEPDGRPRRRWLSRRPQRSTVAAVVAVIVILAALTGSVYMVLEHRDAARQRQRVAEFAAAARQGVVTLTSLDFQNAKQGMQRILDSSTGSFKDELLKTSDDFIQVVEQAQVVEQGTVQAVAVDWDSMTDNSAVVLVSSTSEVTNAAGAKRDPRKYRLIVTITRDGDQLKMSKVEFVP